jgi:hypothetical protein
MALSKRYRAPACPHFDFVVAQCVHFEALKMWSPSGERTYAHMFRERVQPAHGRSELDCQFFDITEAAALSVGNGGRVSKGTRKHCG